MRADREALAKEVLYQNWRGSYTIPSGRLYPFQWNWDAGFHALGWSYIDIERSFQEIESMFKGQWKNGMLPHVVFHEPNEHYFPGPAEWDIACSDHAPDQVLTTGITQLPVFGFLIDRMARHLGYDQPGLKPFLERIYPKILAFHRYLFHHRDPKGEGLVYIQHNWESADNSPMWDEALAAIDISQARDVSALRKDNLKVDATHRPSDDNYKRYIHLISWMKLAHYDDAIIAESHPFLIQDIFFNSLLLKSNIGLKHIGTYLNRDTQEIQHWIEKSTTAIQQKLWNEADGFYYSYNVRTESQIRVKTSAGFMPLFAGICTSNQAARLVNELSRSFVGEGDWRLCPSTAVSESTFDPLRYWRGPVWVNVNWMIYHALRNYDYPDWAERIKQDTLQLIERYGMYEYFDPRPYDSDRQSSVGLGADQFSWTAVIYLDFLNNELPC